MTDPRRHAAALLALAVVLSFAAPLAAAAEPNLLAQIDDATPTPTAQAQPPLSEEPPQPLAGDDGEDDGTDPGGGKDPTEPEEAPDAERLPDTGIDAGIVALLGIGLIASGSGLRITLGRGNAV